MFVNRNFLLVVSAKLAGGNIISRRPGKPCIGAIVKESVHS